MDKIIRAALSFAPRAVLYAAFAAAGWFTVVEVPDMLLQHSRQHLGQFFRDNNQHETADQIERDFDRIREEARTEREKIHNRVFNPIGDLVKIGQPESVPQSGDSTSADAEQANDIGHIPTVAVAPDLGVDENCEEIARQSYIERTSKNTENYRIYLREKEECISPAADSNNRVNGGTR